MGKSKDISPTKRAQISILHDQNMSYSEIAKRLHIAKSTVCRAIARIGELKSYKSRKRSGRPRITSPRTDRKVRRVATEHPTWSSMQIALETRSTVSSRTVRRRLLTEFNLASRRPARKPRLTAKNIKDRLRFCRVYRQWTSDNWMAVLFSDESTFSQFRSYVRHVRRPRNERYNTRYVIPSVRQAPTTMVWGSVSGTGRGGLWFMPKNTTINGEKYLSILKDKLLLNMRLLNCSVFQHDGAPCHRAAVVTNWLRQQGVDVLEPWPGSSPDLNPIENLWIYMKRKVAAKNPSSEIELIKAIKVVWTTEITPEYTRNLVRSMPDRIKAVIANKGRHTKY